MTQSPNTDERVAEGRAAFARHDWQAAVDGLTQADAEQGLSAPDLIDLAESNWWIGRVDEALAVYERAYSAALNVGDDVLAARAAIWLAFSYPEKSSVSNGWLAKARRLLKDKAQCVEHGMISQVDTNIAVAKGDLEVALEHAGRTYSIGEAVGSADLLAFGLFDQGNVLIAMGKVEEGFPLLDEAMVAAVSGDLHPRVMGTIYCAMITTCTRMADYKRASEWTDAADRWCGRNSITVFPGLCRVYRAAIMRLRGVWDQAEEEARLAQETVGNVSTSALGEAFYEIGEIRLRVGDLEAAEEAFRQAHQSGRDPNPGLAYLCFRQGDIQGARSMIDRAVANADWDQLALGRLLPTQIEIHVAAGDHSGAHEASQALEKVAETYGTAALKAEAASSSGLVAIAEDDVESAIALLRSGIRFWQEVDAPYEGAMARVNLGRAYLASGDRTTAALELESARATFEQLGASPDLLRAQRLIEESVPAGAAIKTTRQERTFMFTDICRSTDLMEAMGDEAWEVLLQWHDKRLRSLFVQHSGEEIKHSGDGFFIAFPAPSDAAECAVAVQRALDEHRRTAGFAPQVRIGFHQGKARRRGSDYFGRGVNIAARIGAQGEAGEILASSQTLAACGDGYDTSEPRAVRLKGISEPVEIVSVDWRQRDPA
ncbi:MAG: hypothetical protein IIA90_03065 [Chloroflexi bacterium]|nr:hypothetical protein [Chloroflexota bacterium]